MRINRLLPLAAVAGLTVGLGVAAFPADPHAAVRTGPKFTPTAWSMVFDFVATGSQSDPKTVTVTNTGGSDEVFSSVKVAGDNPHDFKIVGDACSGHTLAAGASCDVSVAFTPTVTGTRVANVRFNDNTDCPNWINLAGSGTGGAAPAVAHAASCDGPESTTVTTTTPAKTTTTTTTNTTTVTRTTTVAKEPSQQQPQVNTQQATRIIRLPARKCRSKRAFRIHLQPPAGKTFRQISVQVNGRSLRVVRGKDITSKVDLTGLPRGRFTLRIRATLLPSGTYVRTRHYVTCVPGKKS